MILPITIAWMIRFLKRKLVSGGAPAKRKKEICILLQIHAFCAGCIEKTFQITYYKIVTIQYLHSYER